MISVCQLFPFSERKFITAIFIALCACLNFKAYAESNSFDGEWIANYSCGPNRSGDEGWHGRNPLIIVGGSIRNKFVNQNPTDWTWSGAISGSSLTLEASASNNKSNVEKLVIRFSGKAMSRNSDLQAVGELFNNGDKRRDCAVVLINADQNAENSAQAEPSQIPTTGQSEAAPGQDTLAQPDQKNNNAPKLPTAAPKDELGQAARVPISEVKGLISKDEANLRFKLAFGQAISKLQFPQTDQSRIGDIKLGRYLSDYPSCSVPISSSRIPFLAESECQTQLFGDTRKVSVTLIKASDDAPYRIAAIRFFEMNPNESFKVMFDKAVTERWGNNGKVNAVSKSQPDFLVQECERAGALKEECTAELRRSPSLAKQAGDISVTNSGGVKAQISRTSGRTMFGPFVRYEILIESESYIAAFTHSARVVEEIEKHNLRIRSSQF